MELIEKYLRNLKKNMANINFLSKKKKSCCSGEIDQLPHKSNNKKAISNNTKKESVRF